MERAQHTVAGFKEGRKEATGQGMCTASGSSGGGGGRHRDSSGGSRGDQFC